MEPKFHYKKRKIRINVKLLALRTTDSNEGWKLIIIKENSVSLILSKPWRQKNFRN